MRNTVIGMSLAAFVLAILALVRGGWSLVGKGLSIGLGTSVQVLPLLVAAFTVAGLISVLISKEQIERWLGRGSGLKGIFLAATAGALVPGGPYVYFPLAATFLCAGAEIGTAIAFVTAKNLWTLTRLPMEMALLTPEITFIRYLSTFVFPILLGLAANFLFSGRVEAVRQGIYALQKRKK
ncbi:MAG: permease [Desulfovermiculus sp.]|nr:permease [Desulfovermiculus sp.]